jgi:hypothetical protein
VLINKFILISECFKVYFSAESWFLKCKMPEGIREQCREEDNGVYGA